MIVMAPMIREWQHFVVHSPSPNVHWRAVCASFRRVPGHLSVSLSKTGKNMAGMSASGPGPVSTLDQVDKGLKDTLIDALNAILSPVQEVRAAAEERIKVLEVTEGKN